MSILTHLIRIICQFLVCPSSWFSIYILFACYLNSVFFEAPTKSAFPLTRSSEMPSQVNQFSNDLLEKMCGHFREVARRTIQEHNCCPHHTNEISERNKSIRNQESSELMPTAQSHSGLQERERSIIQVSK